MKLRIGAKYRARDGREILIGGAATFGYDGVVFPLTFWGVNGEHYHAETGRSTRPVSGGYWYDLIETLEEPPPGYEVAWNTNPARRYNGSWVARNAAGWIVADEETHERALDLARDHAEETNDAD